MGVGLFFNVGLPPAHNLDCSAASSPSSCLRSASRGSKLVNKAGVLDQCRRFISSYVRLR